MAIFPPEKRIWWNEPLERKEIVWITIAFLWGLVMFSTMIAWHFIGEQNLSNEAYRIDPEVFAERSEAMTEKYTVREEGDTGIPVVHPPAGFGSGGRFWNWKKTRVTGCTCRQWTGSTGSRCNRPISTSRFIRAMKSS